jgi:hypothetical protein
MERCSYCGEPIRGTPVEFGDEVFCSEECLEQFDTGEEEDDYYDDERGDDEYEDDESAYMDY